MWGSGDSDYKMDKPWALGQGAYWPEEDHVGQAAQEDVQTACVYRAF